MIDAPPQLPLFESFASRSSAGAPSSQLSSAPATFSSEPLMSTMIAATSTTRTVHASASSTRAGVGSAATSSSGAKSTAASGPQATLPMITARPHTVDRMLVVPRPTTRADCEQEARPCPWVGCRHHLALEVAESKGTQRTTPSGKPREERPTSLRLNGPTRERVSNGRRPGLASSAAHLVVRRWIDDAVEQLSSMMYTCSLDVARDYPDGIAENSVAYLLGVSHQAVSAETKAALIKFRAGLRELELESEDL